MLYWETLKVIHTFIIKKKLKKITRVKTKLIGKIGFNQPCSSHGVWIDTKNECFCDLGYSGSSCQVELKETLEKNTEPVSPNSIALFVDAFGPLYAKNELSLAYENLALMLKDLGMSVTVIYTGKSLSGFESITSKYQEQGISLMM